MDDRRAFLAATLAMILFLSALRAFLSSVYFLNLEDLGLNATAAYALLLLAPILLIIPPLHRHPRPTLIASAVILGAGAITASMAGRAATVIGLAGVGSAAFLLFLPSLLRGTRAAPIAVGLAAGLAFDAARLLAGTSVEPLAPLLAVVFKLIVTLALVLLVSVPTLETPTPPSARSGATFMAGIGFGAWLFLQAAVFGSAHHVARWNDAPILLISAGTVLGLIAGASLIMRLGLHPVPPRALLAANLIPVFLLIDHAFLHSPILPLVLLAGQAVLVIDSFLLARVLADSPPQRIGIALGIGMLGFLLLTFTFVFTFTFAFVPLRPAWEGREAWILSAAVLLVLAAAALAVRRHAHLPRRAFPAGMRDTRLVALLLILPLVVALIAAATPGTTVIAPEGRDVRVLSYNLHQGFNNHGVLDADLFVRVLGDVDADLVSLQESDTARFTSGNMDIVGLLAHRLGYEAYYGQPTRAQSFGVAILSRYPIQETSLLPLTSSADNRYLVAARVDIDGTDTWFLAIHMALARENRLAQFEEIMAHAERLGGPRILAGDLNSCPNGHCPDYAGDADTVYAQATAQYLDTWTAAGHERDDPAGYTYHSTHPDRRIDYILVSDGFTVRDARVVRSAAALTASDHLPVVAELTLDG